MAAWRHRLKRRILSIFLLTLLSTAAAGQPATADEPTAADCQAWMNKIARYGQQIDTIMELKGVDKFLDELNGGIRGAEAGSFDSLGKLYKSTKAKVASVGLVTPPKELVPLHAALEAYLLAIADAAYLVFDEGPQGRMPLLIECHKALIAYYEAVYTVFMEQGCSGGDTDALKETLIPSAKAQLKALTGGEDEEEAEVSPQQG